MPERRTLRIAILFFMLLVSVCASTGFIRQKNSQLSVYPSDALTETRMLSDYLNSLKGTALDSPVFIFEGRKSGATVFIMGGTHPNESAGILSAVLVLENIRVETGRVIVLPVANISALSQTLPGYAYPEEYTVGTRSFKIGSRATSPLDQWPDPPIFVQKPSNQFLSYEECRNLNRNYPGYSDGNATQQLACAISRLLEEESVDYAFDLHEASITYPVNRAMIVPEKSMDIAMFASLLLAEKGLEVNVEPASSNLRGFSYIDWAGIDGVHPFLIEVPTPVTDRVQGMMLSSLVTEGKDDFIEKVSAKGYTRTPFDKDGFPIWYRCALHIAAITEILDVAKMFDEDLKLEIVLPDFSRLSDGGLAELLDMAVDGEPYLI